MATRICPHLNLIRVFLTFLFSIGAFNNLTFAGSLLISWDSVADSRVAGYKLKYGTTSKSYTSSVDADIHQRSCRTSPRVQGTICRCGW
jgi:hypothetical protein